MAPKLPIVDGVPDRPPVPVVPGQPMTDPFGRRITYLRVSVTDRCNLRCLYCMPAEGLKWLPHDSILTFEEIARVVRVMSEAGVTRVRLTGGEPTVRRDLIDLVRQIRAIPAIEDLSITTNGLALRSLARPL